MRAPCWCRTLCHRWGVLSWSCRRRGCLGERTRAACMGHSCGTEGEMQRPVYLHPLFPRHFITQGITATEMSLSDSYKYPSQLRLSKWKWQRRNALLYTKTGQQIHTKTVTLCLKEQFAKKLNLHSFPLILNIDDQPSGV